MPARRIRLAFATALCLLTVGACRDREPQERFARDLGTEGMFLLPSARQFAWANDDSILGGRAEIVKPGEVEVSVAPQAAGAEFTPPATSTIGEALGALGQAFVGGLLGAPAELDREDLEAIHRMFADYNAAFGTKDYRAIVGFHVESEQDSVDALLQEDEELDASMAALADVLEEKQAGSKARVEELVRQLNSPVQLRELRATGPDSAIGVASDGQSYRFERQAGEWRVGFEPPLNPQQILQIRQVKQVLIEWVDALTDEVLAQTKTADEALSEFTARMQALIARTGG